MVPGALSEAYAAPKGEYLSQTYVDTVVQRAYENFSVSMSEAGSTMGREAAISQARAVVDRLKRLSLNDPNKNYILWKISELEYQIFLEERELVTQAQTKDIARLNELADAFNAEVGKERPDFVKLEGLFEQFLQFGQAKGKEIRTLITRRAGQVAGQVTTQIQAALTKGDIETARVGIDYCFTNRGSLPVTNAQRETFTASIQSRVKLADHRRFIEEDLLAAQRAASGDDFHHTYTLISQVDRRMADISTDLSAQQQRMYQAKRDRIVASVTAREDSLVDVNIAIYNTDGRSAAQDYMDKVLRCRGVSREKLAVVDEAMLGAAALEKKEFDPALRRVFVDLADEPSTEEDVLGSLGKRAKIRAQEREDSATAAQTEAEFASRKNYERENRREIKRMTRQKQKQEKRLAREEQQKQELDERSRQMVAQKQQAELALAQDIKTPSAVQRTSDQSNFQLAQQNIVLIYNLIEQGLVSAAYDRFVSLREPLRQHLVPEAYATLESTVISAYEQTRNTR